MKKWLFILLAGIFTATLTPTALAGEYTDQVSEYLDMVADVFAEMGVSTTTHGPSLGFLRRGESKSFDVELDKGTSYFIVAVCDDDCSKLSFSLKDENGNVIKTDRIAADMPAVSVTPRWTGHFSLRITMTRCATLDCAYGIRVFGK